jgi:nicotinamidase-related amidase
MPLTTIDTNTALVVIDLQKGIVAYPTVHPIGAIVERSARLAQAFRARGLPVVLVNVAGRAPGRTDAGPNAPKLPSDPAWAELVPELAQQDSDCLITKHRLGAFLGTELDSYLRARGVTQIVLTGVATSIGVESTARSAYDLGYNVTLVTDAVTDMNPETHQHTVEKIFPRLGETGSTDGVLALLAARPA